jgi:putative FmdB family regulatory protein
MPVYEYECQACKFYTEVMQKITDAPLIKCPSCGKRRLKRLVSAPVFRLKGGGWYETDFKSDKEAKRNLLAAEKEEAKAESKAEAKAEAKENAGGTGKEGAGKEVTSGKESPGKETKESAADGASRREQSKGASRGKGSATTSEAPARLPRQTAAPRPAAARRSTRSTPRRKARRGRR